ncbi:hypothetical protein PSPO01_11162 [Paraphaeosphaeria sporulosa]
MLQEGKYLWYRARMEYKRLFDSAILSHSFVSTSHKHPRTTSFIRTILHSDTSQDAVHHPLRNRALRRRRIRLSRRQCRGEPGRPNYHCQGLGRTPVVLHPVQEWRTELLQLDGVLCVQLLERERERERGRERRMLLRDWKSREPGGCYLRR